MKASQKAPQGGRFRRSPDPLGSSPNRPARRPDHSVRNSLPDHRVTVASRPADGSAFGLFPVRLERSSCQNLFLETASKFLS